MLIWYSRRRWDSSDHNDNGAFALHFDQNLDTSSSGSSVCRRSWVIFYTLSEFEQNLGKRQPRVLEGVSPCALGLGSPSRNGRERVRHLIMIGLGCPSQMVGRDPAIDIFTAWREPAGVNWESQPREEMHSRPCLIAVHCCASACGSQVHSPDRTSPPSYRNRSAHSRCSPLQRPAATPAAARDGHISPRSFVD